MRKSGIKGKRMWCDYRSAFGGFCGHLATYKNRCKKHLGKEEKAKRVKGIKFRGDSKFAKENGFFEGKKYLDN